MWASNTITKNEIRLRMEKKIWVWKNDIWIKNNTHAHTFILSMAKKWDWKSPITWTLIAVWEDYRNRNEKKKNSL